ncbi:MAG: hypothetical protein H6753_02845 [Candidatus Omnitrophica bacterium]|nr:hypothetical protein [Candidatus Omnitrophota bacterium]
MRNIKAIKNFVYVIILILGWAYIVNIAPRSYAYFYIESKLRIYTKGIDIQHGDFIFQHLPGELTAMIADMTKSQYSHCGIIVKKPTGFVVLQAIGPVKETPLNEWINYGVGKRFTIVRLKKKFQSDIPAIISQGYKFVGKPYDIQYQWDDQKIYCSELIYKAVFNATGLRLAEFVRLGDMAWQPYEQTIRQITGGELPLDREMITPESLVVSDKVDVVYVSK